MTDRTLRLFAWTGPLSILLFGIGMIGLAKFIPPLDPAISAQAVAARYAEGALGIRLGGMTLLVGATLSLPFAVVISLQLARIEGGLKFYSLTQLIVAPIVQIFILTPALFWCMASYRPERSPEVVQAISDLGWVMMVGPAPPAMLQLIAIGLCILSDRRPTPLFPRWLGFYNLWTALLYLPGILIPLFHRGPFAWNGLLAFWMVAVMFAAWFFVMFTMLLRAIARPD